MRIEKGTYGICRDCGEPLPGRRVLDAGVHLQGKAEGVSTELQHLIRDFYGPPALLRAEEWRHVAPTTPTTPTSTSSAAGDPRVVAAHLLDLGAPSADPAKPSVAAPGKGDGWRALAAEDASANQQFVDTWRPRVEAITNARHKGMLKVVLGEMLEHKRLFDQAAAGRDDLIGTHLSINPRAGVVANTRWME